MPVSCERLVLSGRSLRRADHSFRGVLLSVVCLTKCDFETLAGPLRTVVPWRYIVCRHTSIYICNQTELHLMKRVGLKHQNIAHSCCVTFQTSVLIRVEYFWRFVTNLRLLYRFYPEDRIILCSMIWLSFKNQCGF